VDSPGSVVASVVGVSSVDDSDVVGSGVVVGADVGTDVGADVGADTGVGNTTANGGGTTTGSGRTRGGVGTAPPSRGTDGTPRAGAAPVAAGRDLRAIVVPGGGMAAGRAGDTATVVAVIGAAVAG